VFDNNPPKKRGPKAKWERMLEEQAALAAASASVAASDLALSAAAGSSSGEGGPAVPGSLPLVQSLLTENQRLRHMVHRVQMEAQQAVATAAAAAVAATPLSDPRSLLAARRGGRGGGGGGGRGGVGGISVAVSGDGTGELDQLDDIEAVGAMLHLATDSPASAAGERGIDAWQLPGPIIPTAEEEGIM
jgi:hypothetical protein